ncbi:MAG: flagellar hook-length control protein FliK [Treponema sp.]|nr:flagellar hook-length control protein FliK [Treponema sp.]
MQAIISDIIVNQALQTGNLQISQLTQNNSSTQQSFIDMLNSVRKQETDLPEKETELKTSYEDKKPVEVSDTEKDQKPETAERTENKNSEVKNSESKATEEEGTEKSNLHKDNDTAPKLLNKGNPETNGKKVESKDADNKDQNLSLTKNLKKTDEKNLNVNVEEEIAETTELSENAAIQTASSMNAVKSELNVETKVSDNNVLNEIDTETLSLSENKNDLLQNKLTADEKVYALDKDSKIIVRDQRTEQPETKPSEKNNSKAQLQVQYDNQNNATITMELAEQTASENILSLDNQTVAAEGSNFQAMLNNQIQANAPEFVKAGSLILQDNNKGTINLVLHPDDLGNVKIHLSMDGKTVSAHITVNTKEALEVFKDNAQTLREAFAKNGYETSNFDVSYNGSSNNQNQEFEGRYDGIEYMARKVYNESLGGGNDGYIPDSYEFAQNSEYSINIVA